MAYTAEYSFPLPEGWSLSLNGSDPRDLVHKKCKICFHYLKKVVKNDKKSSGQKGEFVQTFEQQYPFFDKSLDKVLTYIYN